MWYVKGGPNDKESSWVSNFLINCTFGVHFRLILLQGCSFFTSERHLISFSAQTHTHSHSNSVSYTFVYQFIPGPIYCVLPYIWQQHSIYIQIGKNGETHIDDCIFLSLLCFVVHWSRREISNDRTKHAISCIIFWIKRHIHTYVYIKTQKHKRKAF